MFWMSFITVHRRFSALRLKPVAKMPVLRHICFIKQQINMKTLLAVQIIQLIVKGAAFVQHLIHLSGHLIK
ncbi:hypothetical protein BDD43_5523 [Mucilaginibacter gracilis]|uniref:Uncharacterized protein n=1 Tax=Mucilaginibacter gracilis TaxID=423350 RepID=A0A495JB27_9SPHI|nr:hypothetical protein BDD43_5523 [Mucilaginibacter gracilis]